VYFAVILYCTLITDSTTCDVMIRKNQLFETKLECKKEIYSVAKGLISTGHYVKAKCFEFNHYGESA
tara:strand:+ start:399 stop:599 length:201 start_codon:yes stop_codon:yes gene_type:complete